MDIQTEKIELVKLLLQTEDSAVIEAIRNIFKSEKKDFWNDLDQDQIAEIQLGIDEADAGKVVDFDEFVKSYR